jgi:ion channel-forming bestrophin family protein
MVDYNPKSWWKLIFMFHKSDTFRILAPAMVGIATYTAIVAYVELEIFHSQFKNTTVVHSLVGFVLSMLLVFRTNTAYDRWWEGRKIWGSFTNNSRNLALKLNAILKDDFARKNTFKVLIVNYILATKEHLRSGVNLHHLEELEAYKPTEWTEKKHIPNHIMGIIYKEIDDLLTEKKISNEQLIYLNQELISFTDNIGACERIRRTPIPYAYSMFMKKVIFLYVLTMPIGFVIDFKFWSIPIVTLVFYVFASIEVIAEEIEDPFGKDANDLPLDRIYTTIKDNLEEILGK